MPEKKYLSSRTILSSVWPPPVAYGLFVPNRFRLIATKKVMQPAPNTAIRFARNRVLATATEASRKPTT